MTDQPPFYPDLVLQVRKIASRGRMDDADVQIIFDAADAIQKLEGTHVQQLIVIDNHRVVYGQLNATIAKRDAEIGRLKVALSRWMKRYYGTKRKLEPKPQKIENLLLTPEEQVTLHDDLRRIADERKTRLLGRVPLIARLSPIQEHKAAMRLIDAAARADYGAMMAESINDRKDEAIRSE